MFWPHFRFFAQIGTGSFEIYGMEVILKYFPDLTDQQYRQLRLLKELYSSWNEKINVISRKDIDHLYVHHVLHSLSIFEWNPFQPHSRILDLGCGGGFPGIPLAIMMPDVHFHLIDARAKKIKVVHEVVEACQLDNVAAVHGRAEELDRQFDYVVTRAVAPMGKLWEWVGTKLRKKSNHERKNGIIALKGGNLMNEMEDLPAGVDFQLRRLSTFFEEDFFEEKMIAYAFRSA